MPTAPARKSGRQGPVKKLDLKAVARILRDHGCGESVASLARRHGVSGPTIKSWCSYAGLDEYWLKQVRQLERSNWVLLKRAQRAETNLKAATHVIKRLEPSPKRRATYASALQAAFALPRQQTNMICGISKSTGQVCAGFDSDHVLVDLMKKYLQENPGAGFKGMFDVALKSKGYLRSHAIRAYREARLAKMWRKKPVHVPERIVRRIMAAGRRDEVWSIDFLVDALPTGKRYYVFSAVDTFSRECVACIALAKATGQAVVDALEVVRKSGRKAKTLHSDNGSQFKSVVYEAWTRACGIKRRYSRPYHSSDNACVERFNRTLRDEVLNWYRFKNLAEVQRMLDDWRVRYNMGRPHMSLHGLSPLQFVSLYS